MSGSSHVPSRCPRVKTPTPESIGAKGKGLWETAGVQSVRESVALTPIDAA